MLCGAHLRLVAAHLDRPKREHRFAGPFNIDKNSIGEEPGERARLNKQAGQDVARIRAFQAIDTCLACASQIEAMRRGSTRTANRGVAPDQVASAVAPTAAIEPSSESGRSKLTYGISTFALRKQNRLCSARVRAKSSTRSEDAQ
ncbi:hypothetical protein [Bosea sp. NBC_00550]|uniref:hypothetical protein n=1 Tax=Bosea sp. NBC_00550 TaxID=2969621 RepID=UPI0022328AD0|nr:hypothetical protein [Bosea sp. NBC_00550]UZF93440.1 hypothetical protein NWE53_04325 [Bosea sp. NBC_00550]